MIAAMSKLSWTDREMGYGIQLELVHRKNLEDFKDFLVVAYFAMSKHNWKIAKAWNNQLKRRTRFYPELEQRYDDFLIENAFLELLYVFALWARDRDWKPFDEWLDMYSDTKLKLSGKDILDELYDFVVELHVLAHKEIQLSKKGMIVKH